MGPKGPRRKPPCRWPPSRGAHRGRTGGARAARGAPPRTAFVSDQLQAAQGDPRGELIAAVDALGEQVVVLAATDGRLLARWPIAHDAPLVNQDGFDSPRAVATWSPDGGAIIAVSRHDHAATFKAALVGGEVSGRVSVFDADPAVSDSEGGRVEGAQLTALIDRNVPWRVEGGRLVPALATLSGRIVRDGQPVSGVALSLVFRKPPEFDGEVLRRRVTITHAPLPPLAVSAEGDFSTRVQPGRYTIRVSERGAATGTLDIDVGVGDMPREIDLAVLQAR